MWSVFVTFYGAADNDPPGSTEIAHPNDRHQEAGGSGTYADPLSLAADPRAIPVGTRVYYPPLRKYFVMEDDCAQCITDWRSSRRPHIDLWTGDFQGSALLACENALTPDGLVAVEVNPPPGRPVDPRPLFNGRGCTT
jgi:3D (Asp-Asp-Asp) domain-containing protein